MSEQKTELPLTEADAADLAMVLRTPDPLEGEIQQKWIALRRKFGDKNALEMAADFLEHLTSAKDCCYNTHADDCPNGTQQPNSLRNTANDDHALYLASDLRRAEKALDSKDEAVVEDARRLIRETAERLQNAGALDVLFPKQAQGRVCDVCGKEQAKDPYAYCQGHGEPA